MSEHQFPDPVVRYGPRALDLFERASAARVPLNGSIELTHRCNLACVHCYVNLPAADRGAQRREMTSEQICRIVDELAELGTLTLTLTGGEPLLRPDFADIYRYAHKKGLVLTVYTNATLITEKMAALFAELPPRNIDITQYGYTPIVYDAVTGAGDGQYQRFYRGYRRLREAGVTVTLKTIAMRSNVHEVPAIRDFAQREGLGFRFDAIITARIDGGRGPLKERLPPEEVARIEASDAERQEAWAEYCTVRAGSKPASDDLYQCGAGHLTFLIDPYGLLHVCELSRAMGWDVVAGGFAAGWYGAVVDERARKRSHTEGCGSCATYSACNNCVGLATLEGLTPDDGHPYMCQVTDARNQLVFGEDRQRPNGLIRLRLGREGSFASR